ncbi:MAG: PEP-CTERM sorting domain-containing protein [Burkholderiales bacterium]|nr:PEP-CTERM sorting domain-containing protein [Burkholderiales bacterium]
MFKISKLVAAAAALVGVVGAAQATPIVGTVNLTVGQVKIGPGYIDWNNDPVNIDPPPNGANVTVGSFEVIPLKTGSFSTVPTGSVGTVRDIADPIAIPGDIGNAFGIGVPSLLTNFITFAARPNWAFTAHYLAPGALPGTPFTLVQIGNSVTVSMNVTGFACDTGMDLVCDNGVDDVTRWSGVFTAQYADTTVAEVIAKAQADNLENNSWSATITARVPEPTALALVGVALLGAGVAARRTRKQA